MQIESCGYAQAISVAGAVGLFQVMPDHFKEEEDPFDPDTNAFRGLSWLQKTLKSGGSTSMALAGYNAGIARAKNPYFKWPDETERYVNWGLSIYYDTKCGYDHSSALENWLSKGGSALCNKAATEQHEK
jgi:soluble lytic murein transglycosylase-like protein